MIPGFDTLAKFARHVGLPYMTVKNQMKAGHCKYPYRSLNKDGRTKHPLYKTWDSMIGRCYHKTNASYKNYGARGITVCQEWLDDFANFLRDMGNKPEGHTLDRIDNDKGYSKDNCRWATWSEQIRNQRRFR